MIRDWKGAIIACLSSPKVFHTHSIVAKYNALRKAISFCMDLGFENVQFEGDSQLRVNAILSEADCEVWYRHYWEGIEQLTL